MPAYDFVCEECQATFEVRATIAEYERGLQLACPHCRSATVRRAISSVAVLSGEQQSAGGQPPRACGGSDGPCWCRE